MSQEQESTPASEQPPAPAQATPPAQPAEEEPPKEQVKEMRAVVLTGFGGLKTVKVLRKPEPALNAGEVLIRVKACGLNFQDLMVRQGAIDSPPKTPFIMGFECSGEIEQVAEGEEKFKVGDRVVALPEYRAWAELVAVPSQYVFPLPANISYRDGAALTMNYIVAYTLLFELGGLTPGKSVLLHSAGGGVGHAVIQLCRTLQDITIIGVASKGKHEALKEKIDHLLERGSDYANEVRKISAEGVDIVLDCLCGEECNRSYSLLKPMGKYVLYGSANVVTGETKSILSAARSWWQVDKVSPIKLFDENKTLSGFNLRHLMFQQNGAGYISKVMEKILQLWNDGKINPVIDSVWALEDIPEAMQKMHDHKNIGKILLDPSMEPKPKPATPAKGKAKTNEKDEKKKEEESNEDKSPPETENKEKENSS